MPELSDKNYGYPVDEKVEMKVISTDSLLTYQFPYLGKYLLRLMVNNGENFQYKFFNLTVSAGYDEGLAILTEDETGKANLSFLKTLTEQEIADGVKHSVKSDFFKDLDIKNPQAIISPNNKAIYISDDEGRILVFNQQTMALDMICRPEQLSNSYITSFSGYFYSSSSDKLGCYVFTNDKKVYRFDSNMGELSTLTSTSGVIMPYEDIQAEFLLKADYKYAPYIDYTNSVVTCPYSNFIYLKDYSESYKLLAVSYPRYKSSGYFYLIAELKEDPGKYVVIKEYYRWDKTQELNTYNLPDEPTISNKTKFINGKTYKDYLYYVYNNKIYRWDFQYKGMPAVGDFMPFDIPSEEQILDICFNSDGSKLLVVTYNSMRSTELKGSIYAYDPDTTERLADFEGVIHKAVDMIYKTL